MPLPELVAGAPRSIEVASPAFSEGGRIPSRYTCDGGDVSPPLLLKGVPEKARSLLILVYDPDAPGGVFIHWLLYSIPPATTYIPEAVPKTPVVQGLGVQGRNSFGRIGYNGPCPPRGDRPHRYVFLVVALDVPSTGLGPGATWKTLEERVRGHVLAYGYTYGLYSR
ncbi:hypothetical protein CF15_06540 [Pyrodictium occultum]|uniref:Phosphatidylethanolamine-binding protein n=1 Tax=Pyrodictium occultum TaxID=2309 RepID=A0A0V8RXJ5_PYROC|nr:hypothetical protein CF15_06540 [Pyrodictium occultum]